MAAFQSKWDNWEPQKRFLQTDKTDKTDKSTPIPLLSALSVNKNRVLPEPAECSEPLAEAAAPEPIADDVPPPIASVPRIERFCRICKSPADDSDSNIVRDRLSDLVCRRVHFGECYAAWFQQAFGRPARGGNATEPLPKTGNRDARSLNFYANLASLDA